jgi:hypothetical protein
MVVLVLLLFIMFTCQQTIGLIYICAKLACTLMGRGSWLDFDCIPDFPVTSLQADHSGIFCIFHFELPMT